MPILFEFNYIKVKNNVNVAFQQSMMFQTFKTFFLARPCDFFPINTNLYTCSSLSRLQHRGASNPGQAGKNQCSAAGATEERQFTNLTAFNNHKI